LLTGRIFDATEAHALGLVNEVLPEDRLLVRARELAEELLGVSPTSLLRTKQLLREFTDAELEEDIRLAVAANAAIRTTEDFREGIASFLEKRHPNWTGR
jgi:enoyl-CoA hydratase/carnithine racemase